MLILHRVFIFIELSFGFRGKVGDGSKGAVGAGDVKKGVAVFVFYLAGIFEFNGGV